MLVILNKISNVKSYKDIMYTYFRLKKMSTTRKK